MGRQRGLLFVCLHIAFLPSFAAPYSLFSLMAHMMAADSRRPTTDD
jgi:hypothetical protein